MVPVMFGSLRTFFWYLAGEVDPRTEADDHNCRLVTAALLTRVATVHSEMSEVRRKALYTIVQSRFGLDDRATERLLDEAAALNSDAIDLYHFTRQLNEILNHDGRRQVVQMMWEVVYADGQANEYDTNIIWRAADLLGVSSRQRVELRQQVFAERAAFSQVCSVLPQSAALAPTAGK